MLDRLRDRRRAVLPRQCRRVFPARRADDVIIPPSTNTIFRTYPAGAVAAPYATHVVDLSVPEEALWSAVSATHRRQIRAAAKGGVMVRTDAAQLRDVPRASSVTRFASRRCRS